ncbi:tRNA (adenosine(37)-N6)-dimethylallyltransferase MiaA [Patescibacteria group bacterium]|nr:tRNA (adenosine(37)-N6)-dimethylallyltransferase MiaA [Patescibacteria group bacterium]MBU1703338.1 tRNA (adenosine(37)-N6)-dimethylallyltransferase MiaA [Patescibacteria group bacterium]MBU1954407.1 tRNA (adenosine(37)-N6)-dimethylallyltransferase MiaA [Patescibacteria group bacterium]
MKIYQEIKQFLSRCEAENKPAIIAIVGPTASGKTALSLKIAHEINGEIISADSRQVYKYMDIGTDKLHESKMEGIKHHLIDIIDPSEQFTLSDYKRLAIKAINEIHRRKKIPILCGGTGLYINAIIQNYQVPVVSPQYDLRQELARYYEEHGAQALHDMLKERDPEAANQIHPNNVTYVIRALEINIAGNQNKKNVTGEQEFAVFVVGIDWSREVLYERINRRVDDLIGNGLLNEVKSLFMRGYNEKMPSMSSIGYQELIEFLSGNVTLEQAIENIKKNTRNYCKRQQTWFRRYRDIHWLDGQNLQEYLSKQSSRCRYSEKTGI